MKQKLLKRKCNEDNLNKQRSKVDLIERRELLENKEKSNSESKTPLVSTYNRMLPNISEVNLQVPIYKSILAHSTSQLEFLDALVNKPTIVIKICLTS